MTRNRRPAFPGALLAALLLLQLSCANGLQICQQEDLCISLEHQNVTDATAANGGAQGRYLLTASSAQRCGVPAARAGPAVDDSQTVVLVRIDGAGADSCSLADILIGASHRAGVILAGDTVPPGDLPEADRGLPPAVLVSQDAGQQILYLSKIVDSKVTERACCAINAIMIILPLRSRLSPLTCTRTPSRSTIFWQK